MGRIGAFCLCLFVALACVVSEPRDGDGLALIYFTLGIIFAAAPGMRIGKRFLPRGLVAVLTLVGCFHAVEALRPPFCDPEQDGAALIRLLDAYRAQHGRYPATLDEAGIRSPCFRCGVFEYSREEDGTCGLSIGDYYLDRFTASWSSDGRRWHIDR